MKRNDERRHSSEGVKTEGGDSAPSKVSGFLTVRVEKANFY